MRTEEEIKDRIAALDTTVRVLRQGISRGNTGVGRECLETVIEVALVEIEELEWVLCKKNLP